MSCHRRSHKGQTEQVNNQVCHINSCAPCLTTSAHSRTLLLLNLAVL